MPIKAVIFDLDGVIVSTDEYHYRAWKQLSEEEGISFDREVNHRLRGVSRMESLDILLERASRRYTPEEKQEMAWRKNETYGQLLSKISPSDILPGVLEILDDLKQLGIQIAIGSSSKNAPVILKQIGMEDRFYAIVDGNDIVKSKPDPEVFLLAAERLGTVPAECLVIEDASVGVEAATAAGMACLAVGVAAGHPSAVSSAEDLSVVTAAEML